VTIRAVEISAFNISCEMDQKKGETKREEMIEKTR
jgi:hypothetical protein